MARESGAATPNPAYRTSRHGRKLPPCCNGEWTACCVGKRRPVDGFDRVHRQGLSGDANQLASSGWGRENLLLVERSIASDCEIPRNHVAFWRGHFNSDIFSGVDFCRKPERPHHLITQSCFLRRSVLHRIGTHLCRVRVRDWEAYGKRQWQFRGPVIQRNRVAVSANEADVP